MIVYAINDTPLIQFDNLVMCESHALTFSWADIRITEVSFDGNDERIEITNIWDQDFSWAITISWVKSSPVSYNIQLPSTLSLIFWDSLSNITGAVSTVTGQWFSISDTTWLILSLFVDWITGHLYSFSKTTITQIPNTFWLESVRSGTDLFWRQTTDITNYNTLLPVIANPWVLFCSPEIEIIIDDPIPEYTWWDIDYDTGAIYSWADIWSWYEQEPDIELPSDESEPEEETPIPPQDTWLYTPPPLKELPCVISEIHPTTDITQEYVEFICDAPFSGSLKTIWIGVWETNKDILINTHGGYWLVSSSMTWFITPYNITLITSMSLRDAGETITLSLSWYITWFTSFPDIPSGKSFYPLCWITGCVWLPSPWFSEQYLSGFIVWPITVATTPTSTSTYYQELYNKRKSTAESYKTENSTLKKEQTRISKELTTLQKKAQSDAKKTDSKTTTKATSVKVTATKSTAKTTTAKATKTTTTKKTPTVSTTSKAYVKLVDEHKLYKSYVAFIDSYLKSRLYTQYSTLWLSKVKGLLTNSLKAIGKQNYIIPLSWSTTGISVFDFNRQLGENKWTIDTLYISLFHQYVSFFSSVSNSLSGIFLAKDISKDKLIEWKNLSKNDIWNDIMGTKISEMSFSLLE